jgi:hypothetical protein
VKHLPLAVVLEIAVPGCAQILGIENTTGGGTASLELAHVSIGASVISQPQTLGTAPSFIIDDAAGVRSVAGMTGGDGHWTSPTLGATQVLYTAPDVPAPFQHAIALTVPDVTAQVVVFEHTNPQPAPASTITLAVQLPTPYAAGESFQVIAVGAWMQHALAGSELPLSGQTALASTVPFDSFVAMSASPRARIQSSDAVVVARYSAAGLTGAFVAPPFDQSDSADTLTGVMMAPPADTMVSGAIDPNTVATRFLGLQPAMPPPTLSWRVDAAPGYSAGGFLGVPLLTRTIGATDTMAMAMFANPFAAGLGWRSALSYTATSSRALTLGGAMVALGASLSMVVDPGSNLTLDLPAGLPTAISLGATALVTDGMTVSADPAQRADVRITTDKPCTWYRAQLVEYTVVAGSAMASPIVETAGPSATVTLPVDVMKRGHTYALIGTCIQGGLTGATSGDLQTFALPVAIGQATSAVFTLAP